MMTDCSRAYPLLRAGVAVLLLIALTAPLRAQTREEIEQRNQQLEQQYQSEQQPPPSNLAPATPYGGSGDAQGSVRSGSGSGLTSQLLGRVQVLEDQVRSERGRIDDLTNQLQRQDADLSKQISDLQFKLGQGGPSAAAPPTSSGSGLLEAPGASAPSAAGRAVRRTPERALQEGNAALAHRDYPAAEAAAREVLAAGASPRANDAQFLLAQAESGQGSHQQAAADFYDAYNRSPRSGRAPAALLGVATSLLALNDTRDACQAIAKINAEFPSPSPSIHRAVVGTRARAGCH